MAAAEDADEKKPVDFLMSEQDAVQFIQYFLRKLLLRK